MLDKFNQGWRFALGSWRLIFLVYFLLLMLVLPIGMQIYHVMDASIGNSLSLQTLLKDYDHTVWMDLLNVHGASLSPLLGQLRWIVPFYLLIAVFLQAGLMGAVFQNSPKWKTFWEQGAHWYFSFLKIGLFFLIFFLLGMLIIWLPFSMYIININEWLVDETSLVWLFFTTIFFTIIFFSLVFIWSVRSRFFKMENQDTGIFKAIKMGGKQFGKNLIKYLFLYLFISLPAILFFVLYNVLEAKWGMISPALVWMFVFFQQIFILLRIGLRIALYKAFL
ncbi:MAG: hypothetical protein R2784_13830 [Saprospiraceae bacterium]